MFNAVARLSLRRLGAVAGMVGFLGMALAAPVRAAELVIVLRPPPDR